MSNPLSIACVLNEATESLERAGIASARMDASLLLAHVLFRSREALLMSGNKLLTNNDINLFNETIARRQTHEPIAYIVGKKEFWSLDFYVTRDTLIPRPDSETLIEAALKRVKNRASNTTILDIGTGTGCLLIALLKELPGASGVGVDINERALQVAQKNAQIHGVHERVVFLKSHWCDALNGTFDLIISNPPYIAEKDRATLMQDVVGYEPHAALFAGGDGLDAYTAIVPQVARLLAPGGMCVLEIGERQAEAVIRLLQIQRLITEQPERDLAGIERCVIARKVD
jgi:release factor glutamine methyltransferase